MAEIKICNNLHSNNYTTKPVLLGVFLIILLSGCSFSLAEDITPPPGAEVTFEPATQPPLSGPLYPLVNPDPSAGSLIYAEKCAPCHGPMGLGDGEMAGQLPVPAPALGTDPVARISTPAGWYTIVTQGNLEQRMPPFNSLTDRQRWDVIAYLYSLSSTTQNVIQGEELYQEHCAACHGVKGGGDGPDGVVLSAQPSDFTDQEFMANLSAENMYEAISNGAEDMPSYEELLAPEDIWALTAYLRSLTFAPVLAASTFEETPTPVTTDTGEATPTKPPEPTPSGFGEVGGQVISLSGGEIPENLTVSLFGFDQMQQAFSEETTADEGGNFVFDAVEMPQGRAFLASIEHAGVTYNSDIGVVDEETTSLALIIPYFETTTDKSVLSVDRLHLILQYLEPDTIRVVEMYIISNPSNQVVVAAEEGDPVLSYQLPEGATNLQFEDGSPGERYVEMPDGFGDLAVVRPGAGQHQVIYSYDLPYDDKLEFNQPVQLPVNAVVIMLPEDGLKVAGEQLKDMGIRDVQGIPYHMYSSDPLEAGSVLEMDISGRPKISGPSLMSGSDRNLVIGLAAFGIALILAGGWLYVRSRDMKDVDELPEAAEQFTTAVESQDVDTLFDAILALDDQYRAGELPEEAYAQRRMELKQQIKEILKEEEG